MSKQPVNRVCKPLNSEERAKLRPLATRLRDVMLALQLERVATKKVTEDEA